MPYCRCPECGVLTHSVAGYSTLGVCASCAAPLPFEAPLSPAVTYDRSQVLRAVEAMQNGAFVREEVAQ